MKIARIDVFVLGFPFKSVFVLAGGVAGDRNVLSHRVLVKLTTERGAVGWGEATPTPRWTYETTETIVSTLAPLPRAGGARHPGVEPRRAAPRDGPRDRPGVTTGSPLAKSAIDVAAHDALAARSACRSTSCSAPAGAARST